MANIELTGIVGQDAEIRFTPQGDAVASFSVADDLRRKNAAGQWETASTTWWRCQVWGKTAEALVEHLTKGTRVLVTGTVHERKWEKDGAERSSFDVKARTVGIIPKGEPTPPRAAQDDPWASGSSYSDTPPF